MSQDFSITVKISGPELNIAPQVLKEGEYLLGRDPSSSIRFPKQAMLVSRNHAKLTVSKGEVFVKDLDSTSGLQVNGRVIYETRIWDGDTISLGNYSIKCTLPKAEIEQDDKQIKLVSNELDEAVINLGESLAELSSKTTLVLAEINKRIVGQRQLLRAIWASILADGHILMIGVPGLAKTYTVNAFSEVLGLNFNRIQFTPDLMPADILGSNVIQEDEDGKRHFEFDQGPIFTQLLLADEINRTPPKTQAALLEAMQEHQVTIGKKTLTLPRPFSVIATQNPVEQEGTYPLPEAQKDRFMICCILDYPSADEEVEVLLRTTQGKSSKLEKLLDGEKIMEYRRTVKNIAISRELTEYAVNIVRATRPKDEKSPEVARNFIDYGAGPRAGQALLNCAKAYAAMDGRPAICSDDIKESYVICLRHRIICNYKARADGMDEDSVLLEILKSVPFV
jgi:MoxR-like ATPase